MRKIIEGISNLKSEGNLSISKSPLLLLELHSFGFRLRFCKGKVVFSQRLAALTARIKALLQDIISKHGVTIPKEYSLYKSPQR